VKASGAIIFFMISFFFSSCQSKIETQRTNNEYLWKDQTETHLPKIAALTNRMEIADISVKATFRDIHQMKLHENQPRQPRPSFPKSIARHTSEKREVYRLI